MSSLSSIQRRLDSQFERAKNQLDEATMNASEGYSQADSFAFLKPAWAFPVPVGQPRKN